MPPMKTPVASIAGEATRRAASARRARCGRSGDQPSRVASRHRAVGPFLRTAFAASASASVGQVATARRACASSSAADRLVVDDRIAPLVERDPLGQQLGAQAVARRRRSGRARSCEVIATAPRCSASDARRAARACGTCRRTGRGARASRRRRRRRRARSRTSRTAPSGWRQAPRPSIMPHARRARATVAAGSAPVAEQRRGRARSAGRPSAHGPHWPALSSAR